MNAKPKPTPPRHPKPLTGEIWWVQAPKSRALLTVEVMEVTKRTVLLMQIADGAIRPKPDAPAFRYKISEFQWVERVGDIE